jgi:hypothetical protein
MSNFKDFKLAVSKQFTKLCKQDKLYVTNISKEELWNTYLDSFPEGTNNIYKERREYDCQHCKQFIRRCGNVVAVADNKLVSLWDIEVPGYYQEVADGLSLAIKSKPIRDLFLKSEQHMGVDNNVQLLEDGTTFRWEHFYYKLPNKLVNKSDLGTKLSDYKSSVGVLKRSFNEITDDALDTVLELIDQNSIYRGEEHRTTVAKFKAAKQAYLQVPDTLRDSYCWTLPVYGIKNTVIGTLLTDISEGKELTEAVKAFEFKVAPTNYKRPTAIVTKSMIQNAEKKVQELGISEALPRRYAMMEDITINNVLFADRAAKKEMSVFDELVNETANKPSKKQLDKIEEVSVTDFINNILPKAETVELLVENKFSGNFVSLIAPQDQDAKSILKWNNNFSWSYSGEVADSMREEVVARGGSVSGALRFTHAWNHNGKNQSLMDLHVFMPVSKYANTEPPPMKAEGYTDLGNSRVGWNHRNDSESGGVQDVDHVQPPGKIIPLENITFPSLSRMPAGDYYLKVHNWRARTPNTEGFKAEVEFEGQIFQYEYEKPVKNGEWVNVAVVTLKNKKFSIKHLIPTAGEVSKEIWNTHTENFQKVSVIMNSPNHWDGNETGNKHYFFMLDGCTNPGSARGFFNEFLKDDLHEHRKVFEILGAKMRVPESERQLSGLGFSSTQRNQVVCRVSGSFTRTIKINF